MFFQPVYFLVSLAICGKPITDCEYGCEFNLIVSWCCSGHFCCSVRSFQTVVVVLQLIVVKSSASKSKGTNTQMLTILTTLSKLMIGINTYNTKIMHIMRASALAPDGL